MAKTIKPEDLAQVIQKELRLYSEDVTERVGAAAEKAAKKLVKLTKASAPVASGSYRKNITAQKKDGTAAGVSAWVWGVKAPDHRLTHLLAKSHATPNGGRTAADPFLQNALDEVLPEFENDVKEAVKP